MAIQIVMDTTRRYPALLSHWAVSDSGQPYRYLYRKVKPPFFLARAISPRPADCQSLFCLMKIPMLLRLAWATACVSFTPPTTESCRQHPWVAARADGSPLCIVTNPINMPP